MPSVALEPAGDPAPTESERRAELEEALRHRTEELLRWRSTALRLRVELASIKNDEAALQDEAERLCDELLAVQSTVSWRVTAPIRAVRITVGRLTRR